MQNPVTVAVHGATGRMGRAVIEALAARDDVRLVAALARPVSDRPITLPPDVLLAATLPADLKPDVLIDFSVAAAFGAALALAVERGVAFVSGTTGLDADQRAALDRAAGSIPVLWSANFSQIGRAHV